MNLHVGRPSLVHGASDRVRMCGRFGCRRARTGSWRNRPRSTRRSPGHCGRVPGCSYPSGTSRRPTGQAGEVRVDAVIVANSNWTSSKGAARGSLLSKHFSGTVCPGTMDGGIDTAGIVIRGDRDRRDRGGDPARDRGGSVICRAGISRAGVVIAGISTGGTVAPASRLADVRDRRPSRHRRNGGDGQHKTSPIPTHLPPLCGRSHGLSYIDDGSTR